MFKLLLFMITMLTMLMILLMMILIISKKSFMYKEKSSPFECGFDPISTPRIPFSLHFFLMAIIFLIFDVEIILTLPMIIIMKYSTLWQFFLSGLLLLIILMMGLYHEWYQDILVWTN